MDGKNNIGKKARIILVGGFHYSGKIIDETDLFITIIDKFNSEVSLKKDNIEVLEMKIDNN